MLVSREFKFDSAHFLPAYKGKCENLHGHTYKLRVTFEGEPDKEGMVVDFARIKGIVGGKVLAELDHKNLNDVIANPSAENIAAWIWGKLEGGIDGVKLYAVRVWETEGCFVEVLARDREAC